MGEFYHVVFEMPSTISSGLQSGIYETIGGVVRKVEGKQIVAWLRPAVDAAGDIIETAPSLGPLANGPLFSAALPIAAGAAVAIAVVAVGFVVVLNRLQTIDANLTALSQKLDAIKADTDWLRAAVWINHRASLKSALLGADDAVRDGRFNDLRQHINTFREAQHFLFCQLEMIANKPAPLQLSAVFTDIAQMYVTVIQAKSWSIHLVSGPEAAQRELLNDGNEYSGVRAQFLRSLENPGEHIPSLLKLGPQEWQEASQFLPLLPKQDDISYSEIKGFVPTKEAIAELRSISAPVRNSPPALIVVASELLAE